MNKGYGLPKLAFGSSDLQDARRVQIGRIVRRKSKGWALRRHCDVRRTDSGSFEGSSRQARRVQSGINDSQSVIFREEGVFVADARLHVVNAFHVGNTCSGARVSQRPILRERFSD